MELEFAYSRTMQLILAVVAFGSAYIFLYLIADLITMLYGEKATARQKSIFAVLIGCILNTAWAYAVYFAGGMQSFSEVLYLLVATPNPIFALLYYVVGVKVLRLSPIRSIKLMGHVYLYYILINSWSLFLGSIFFVQTGTNYNYLLETIAQLTFLVVFIAIYFITRHFLRYHKHVIIISDNLFINLKKELLIYFAKAMLIYILMVSIPVAFTEKVMANLVIFIILALFLALNILWDIYQAAKNTLDNKAAYINALLKGSLMINDENIGELNKKMPDNPSFISILLDNYAYATKMHVRMKILLQSSIRDFNMDNVDVCKIIAGLLDHAIKTAVNSERKWVFLSIESKADGSKLVVINNSAAAATNNLTPYKQRYKDKRLAAVRKIIEKYGNCIFQQTLYHDEISTYVEIK